MNVKDEDKRIERFVAVCICSGILNHESVYQRPNARFGKLIANSPSV